jgi:hypothetical protein
MNQGIVVPLKPLLRRSPLLPGESLPSLLARLTHLNGYPSSTFLMRLFCHDYPVRKESLFEEENLKRLAVLTGIPADELCTASAVGVVQKVRPPNRWEDPFPIWTGLTHPMETVWYCPACLAERAYHRWIWQPVSSAVCLRHTCLLMPACPECHQPVSVDDLIRLHCRACFADLRQTHPTTIPTDENEWMAQTILQCWQTGGSVAQNDFPQQSPLTLCRIADGLALGIAYLSRCGAQVSYIPNLSGKSRSLHRLLQHLAPPQTLQIYATAIQCMVNWPEGFRRLLYWCEPDPKRDLEKRVKALIKFWATHLWNCAAFRFVWDAFHDFRSDRLRFLSGVADRGMTFEQLPAYANVGEAAQILEVSREEILNLVRRNMLSPTRVWGKRAGDLFFWREDLRDWGQNQFCLTISET